MLQGSDTFTAALNASEKSARRVSSAPAKALASLAAMPTHPSITRQRGASGEQCLAISQFLVGWLELKPPSHVSHSRHRDERHALRKRAPGCIVPSHACASQVHTQTPGCSGSAQAPPRREASKPWQSSATGSSPGCMPPGRTPRSLAGRGMQRTSPPADAPRPTFLLTPLSSKTRWKMVRPSLLVSGGGPRIIPGPQPSALKACRTTCNSSSSSTLLGAPPPPGTSADVPFG
mmetsp:Transcript_10887/g.30853  ORF Transcript_10887/g.30853 Transcript_10887/m.30853 type:complete len:233 (+) Transcript_10887:482-1180(+)